VNSRFQNLPFKFNLQRYTAAAEVEAKSLRSRLDAAGLYTL
jgi:hypothetical protein